MSACPKCGLNDQVQKVTAIVTSGTTTGMVTYYDSAMYQTRTSLAQRLLPPSEPIIERPGGYSLISLLLFLGLFLFVFGWFLNAIQKEKDILSSPNAQQGIITVIGILVGLLLPAVAILISRRNTARRGEQQEQQIPVWRAAIMRWNQLYYCYRCDVVHVENEKTYANPEGMTSLLMDVHHVGPTYQKSTAPISNVSITNASIETDAQGRWRCSLCKGFVKSDAISCKHCNRQFIT